MQKPQHNYGRRIDKSFIVMHICYAHCLLSFLSFFNEPSKHLILLCRYICMKSDAQGAMRRLAQGPHGCGTNHSRRNDDEN